MNEGPLRSLALYVAIIGSSLFGVFAVLRVGEGLTAPPAVAGVWHLDIAAGDGTAPGCRDALPADATRVTIAQSGQFLVLHFDDRRAVRMEARLGDGVIRGGAEVPGPELPDCPGAQHAEVELTVRGAGLDGALRLASCARCPALNLRATRAAAGEK